ncbi:ATP-binding protein [Streptomyces actinomycinicus]|uniref:ATP-binding protein n=1 Tax=Streptomyces actinomycinicus TaxID=1695166 RepID=A0A937JNT9_9ACTN|nr:ATP-binding protein [Streptomyces actinomycinicus]
MELQALPSRIGQVRRIVSAQLRYWHMDPLIDRAALGVTELLSNVHRHARPDKSCTVELELLPDRLTVSVRDHDPRLPVPVDAPDAADDTPLATCGRGLAMVAAVSESWGARPDGENGKVVWFTLPATAAATTAGRSRPARPTPRAAPAPAAAGVPAAAAMPSSTPAPTPVPAVAVPAGAPVPAGAVPAGAPVPAGAVPAGAPVPAGASLPAGASVASGASVAEAAPVPAGAGAGARVSKGAAPAAAPAPSVRAGSTTA